MKCRGKEVLWMIIVKVWERSDCGLGIGWLINWILGILKECSGLIENVDCLEYFGYMDFIVYGI